MDRPEYQQKKARFDNLLTLFGRKPVLEALQSRELDPVRLHLAVSNRPSTEIDAMRRMATDRHCEILEHTREALARISRNGRQDQGVALDVEAPKYLPVAALPPAAEQHELLALDAVTNPQNLGMIIRSVAASPMHGIILPRKGSAPIDGLVIKASAGTLFKCRIYHCDELDKALDVVRQAGYQVVALDAGAPKLLGDLPPGQARVFVLGNETAGVSAKILGRCDERVSIPLDNDVESLNVSIAAALVAFRAVLASLPH